MGIGFKTVKSVNYDKNKHHNRVRRPQISKYYTAIFQLNIVLYGIRNI